MRKDFPSFTFGQPFDMIIIKGLKVNNVSFSKEKALGVEFAVCDIK